MEFVSAYMALMDVYEARCEALHASVDAACDALVAQSRIPELAEDGLGGGWGVGDRRGDGSRGGRPDGRREEGGGGGKDSNRAANGDGDEGDGGGGSGSGDDDEEEDLEVLQRRVRRKFVAAMEQLQCSRLPKRRRGNLPKEATAVFRSWFAANLDHPYPTDAVKADLSRATGTGVAQVSNWLINYRKRVWKPALQEHAASTGEGGAAKNAPAGGEAAAEDDAAAPPTPSPPPGPRSAASRGAAAASRGGAPAASGRRR